MHLDSRLLTFALVIYRVLPVGVRSEVVQKATLVRKAEIQEEQAAPFCVVSTFAKRRRAKRLRVCHRCLRMNPKLHAKVKCDRIRYKLPITYDPLKLKWIKGGQSKVTLDEIGHSEPETHQLVRDYFLRKFIRSEIDRVLYLGISGRP